MKTQASWFEVTRESHPHLWEPSPPTTARYLVNHFGAGRKTFVAQIHDILSDEAIPVEVDLSNYTEEALDSTYVVIQVRYEGETETERALLGKKISE